MIPLANDDPAGLREGDVITVRATLIENHLGDLFAVSNWLGRRPVRIEGKFSKSLTGNRVEVEDEDYSFSRIPEPEPKRQWAIVRSEGAEWLRGVSASVSDSGRGGEMGDTPWFYFGDNGLVCYRSWAELVDPVVVFPGVGDE